MQSKYFNQAYAVMEYFGYPRREPDVFYPDLDQRLEYHRRSQHDDGLRQLD